MKDRLFHISEWMKRREIDVTILTSIENIFYLSHFYSDPHERFNGIVIFQASEPFLICPQMEVQLAKDSNWDGTIIGYSDIEDPFELLQKAVHKRITKVKNIGIETMHLSVNRFEELQKHFNEAKFFSVEEKLRMLRMVKSNEEIVKIKRACNVADQAIEYCCSIIEEGKSELEIVAEVEYYLKRNGIQSLSFPTIVLTGTNASNPHGIPGATTIKKGDLIVIDLGVIVDGYCSDITRTVALGPIDEKKQEIYDTVLHAQTEAIKIVKQGKKCMHLDLTARTIIKERGYGSYFPHRLGHGLGISIHEFPSITETNPLQLTEGMVFTIEPGIYVPNICGVRIEDVVAVTKNGAQILTTFPKNLQIL